jgi:hypothetical protein
LVACEDAANENARARSARSRSPLRRRLTRSPPRRRPPISRAAHALFMDGLRRAVATWPLPFNISLVRLQRVCPR